MHAPNEASVTAHLPQAYLNSRRALPSLARRPSQAAANESPWPLLPRCDPDCHTRVLDPLACPASRPRECSQPRPECSCCRPALEIAPRDSSPVYTRRMLYAIVAPCSCASGVLRRMYIPAFVSGRYSAWRAQKYGTTSMDRQRSPVSPVRDVLGTVLPCTLEGQASSDKSSSSQNKKKFDG
ncbi:hypothetical protein LX36DRAFT_650858 [Colletotrichum falcatum]|nr:hypothetical protein LX36DRAFT_650858 [Colletotrichum falcatum]